MFGRFQVRASLVTRLGVAALHLGWAAGAWAQGTHAATCEVAPTASSAPGEVPLLTKVVASLGDAHTLESLRGIRYTLEISVGTGPNSIKLETVQVRIYPDHLVMITGMPNGGQSRLDVSPEVAFREVSGGPKTDLPPALRNELLKTVRRDRFYIGQNMGNGKVKVMEGGTEKIGNTEAAVLRLDIAGAQATWYVNPADGVVLRTIAQVPSGASFVDAVVDYSDWRICDGLTIPFRRAINQGGKLSEEKVLSVELNPSVPASPPLDSAVAASTGLDQASSGKEQTLRTIRQRYLNRVVVVRGRLEDLGGRTLLLEWQFAKEKNGRYIAKDALDKLPASYLGKTARVIAVQINELHRSRAGATNALGETISEDDTPNPYFDLVVQFDDGKLGMVTTYFTLLDAALTSVSEQESRVSEMTRHLPEIIGRNLYAAAYSRLYQPDATLEELTGNQQLLKRISASDVPLLEPLTITAAKYFESVGGVVLKVRFPNGREALAFTPRQYLEGPGRVSNNFLEWISGTLLADMPHISPSEIDAVKHHGVLKGMSKTTVYLALGYPEKENDWGKGGLQLIFYRGTILVYLDQDEKVVDTQVLDIH